MKPLLLAAAIATAPLAVPVAVAQAPIPSAAGTLIEQAPLPADAGLSGAARSLRIVYSSTDGVTGRGIVPVSGAVFVPKGKPPRGGWPIVAWAHGTVGIGDACAPSRNARSVRDATFLNKWLEQGYAVVATDYQGLGTPGTHPYLNTRAEAYSVLDSVRAAQSARLGLANRVLIVGQSQGAGAAFATAGEAAGYAPSVRVLGTIATGIPYLNGMPAASGDGDKVDRTIAYLLYIAAAARAVDPALTADMLVAPKAEPLLSGAGERCVGDMMKATVDAGLTRNNSLSPRLTAAVTPYMRGTVYRTLAIRTPVFVGTGEQDGDVPPVMQDALVKAACAAGTRIVHRRYAGLDHSATLNASFPDSSAFARAVMAGKDVGSTCPRGSTSKIAG